MKTLRVGPAPGVVTIAAIAVAIGLLPDAVWLLHAAAAVPVRCVPLLPDATARCSRR